MVGGGEFIDASGHVWVGEFNKKKSLGLRLKICDNNT
jgi:hypothetical protein